MSVSMNNNGIFVNRVNSMNSTTRGERSQYTAPVRMEDDIVPANFLRDVVLG